MTKSSCYFLPVSAAQSVPSCNITRTRHKRLIGSVVSLAVASASLGISLSNSIQIANLQQQIAVVDNTLSTFSQTVEIYGAQLAKLTLKHIELGEELHKTQEIIDEMSPAIVKNSENINYLKIDLEELHTELRHSFLRLGITRISDNILNLDFLSPEDTYKVVNNVIQRGNLTFNHYHKSLPVIQIITKLLVRQQIDFVPRSQYKPDHSEEIGRLVITSFFAIPKSEQTPFYTYKLVTIPFFHGNETIQLAHVPRYWTINPSNNTTMEWQNPEEYGCDLQLMTSCRNTPAIRKISKDSCVSEIIERRPLTKCHMTPVSIDDYFVQHLRDNLWITSSPKPLHCVKTLSTKGLSTIQEIGSLNEEIILPPVSVVNVTDGYTIVCPSFTLLGHPLTSNVSSLVILYNSSVLTKNVPVLDVHKLITKNITWFKKKMTEQQRHELTNFMHEIRAVSVHRGIFSTHFQYSSLLNWIWIILGLLFALLFYIYRCKRKKFLGKQMNLNTF